MVTGNDSNISLAFTELLDSFFNAFTKGIGETKRCNQGQRVFNVFTAFFRLEVLHLNLHLLEFISVEVSVGKSDSLKTSQKFTIISIKVVNVAGHDELLLDNMVEVLRSVVAGTLEVGHLSERIKFAVAHGHNVLWGTLNNEADGIGAVLEGVSNGHSLAVRAERNPKLEDVVTLTLDKLLLDRNSGVEEQVKDTNFDGAAGRFVLSASHLHVGVIVKNSAVPEHVLDFNVAAELISVKCVVNHVDFLNRHVTSG